MTDQPDRRPVLGFAAGTPLLTPEGYKAIEDVKPGDFIQSKKSPGTQLDTAQCRGVR